MNTAYTGQNLRIAFTGNDDATLTENGTEYPIRVWLDDFDRRQLLVDVSRLNIKSYGFTCTSGASCSSHQRPPPRFGSARPTTGYHAQR
ncbi:MAG: hypothetical protein IPN33_26005 [Saprospiraceae bacterium]|nr:hypothetical protein [Saprospiraceae bacterium]